MTIFRMRKFKQLVLVSMLTCSTVLLLSACTSKKNLVKTDADPSMESSLLATDETPVTSDTVADAASPTPADLPVYTALGGETLGRVAHMLYGSAKAVPQLLEKNPDLKDFKKTDKLSQGQKVFFDPAILNPEPKLLTKELLDHYANEFAAGITSNNKLQQSSVAIQKGDTLQKISKRIYGTERYWTELYLVNHEKLAKGYDHIAVGSELTIYNRGAIPAPKLAEPKAEEPAPVALSETPADANTQAEPAAATLNTQEAPSPTPAAETVTPPPVKAEAPVVPPVQVVKPLEQTPPPPADAAKVDAPSVNSSAYLRRFLYVALVLSIAIGAAFMTRTKKVKPNAASAMDTQEPQSMSMQNRPKLPPAPDSDRKIV